MKDQYLTRFVTMTMLSMLVLLPMVIQQQQTQQQQRPQLLYVVDAWTVVVPVPTNIRTQIQHRHILSSQSQISSTSRKNRFIRILQNPQPTLHMAGFGDASSINNDSKEVKLKPKQQWDRYTALKKETSVVVGVKVVSSSTATNEDEVGGDDENSDWLVVGAVKSDSTISTEVAVARQRALLVEHAKRLYPLQISPKAQIEWGYVVNDDTTTEETKDDDSDAEEDNNDISIRNWVTVDKTVLDSIPPVKGIEKQMGFVGTPDPTTGFYCIYNEGRLVKSTDGSAAATRPSSKKIG